MPDHVPQPKPHPHPAAGPLREGASHYAAAAHHALMLANHLERGEYDKAQEQALHLQKHLEDAAKHTEIANQHLNGESPTPPM